jgi:hypothetical protein
MEFLFIVGVARTGSKIYTNILNEYSQINVTSELHFLCPRWIRKDFRYHLRKSVGYIDSPNKVRDLINLMYSGKLNGTFWVQKSSNASYSPNNINALDKEVLEQEILNSTKSDKEIFRVLVEQHMIARNKKRGGAKFPVDISFVPVLMDWFPQSQFIHIIRDPRAIYASMVLRDMNTYSMLGNMKKFSIGIKRLFYLRRQYKQAVRIHNNCKNMNNYYLSRFEDIVTNPEKNLRKLCAFLQIDFNDNMLYPAIRDSSYKKTERKKGFDTKTLSRWKDQISPRKERLIKLLLKNEMNEMGYR